MSEIPTVESNENENVEVVEQQQQEEQGLQSFHIFIKTPVEIGTIRIQVTPTDSLMDIQTFLYETSETCLYSSYEFQLNGQVLPEYQEISTIDGVVEGVTLEMVPIDYNERSARLHVKRLRDIMNTGQSEFSNMSNPSLFSNFSFPEKSNYLTSEQQQAELDKQQKEFEQMAKGEPIEQPKQEEQEQQPEEETASVENKQQSKSKKQTGKKNGKKDTTTKDTATATSEDKLTPQQKERKEKLTEIKSIERPCLSTYYPESSTTPIQCVRSMIYSGWSPVPGYRKLFGDLFYLDITTLEGTYVCVTASTSGFYINQSSVSTFNPTISNKATTNHSLHQLLTQVSRLFRRGLNQILGNISKNHPFDMLPGILPIHNWVSSGKSNRYDINKGSDTWITTQDLELRGNPRDWNEEIQAPKELPKSTIQERIVRDRAISKVNSDFVECAIRGAQVIVSGSLLPINPNDNARSHMFLYNNIFFSLALDTRDTYADCGGDAGARTAANNDLKGIRLYNLADIDGLYTLGTAIIDYKGQRIIAQSLIPGILTNEKTSKICYGSMDNNDPTADPSADSTTTESTTINQSKTIQADPEFHERLLKAASLLHLSESQVLSGDNKEVVKVCTSFESKGIIGIDGRRYILDLIKATPRDPNYVDVKDSLAILRPEAIATYTEYYKLTWVTAKRQSKLKEKQEEQKRQGIDPPTATISDKDIQLTEEEFTSIPSISFNPNVYSRALLAGSEEEQSVDIENLKKVGVFLKDVIIPRLIEDLMLFNVTPADGATLTNTMHTRGINMRYLGFAAKLENATKAPFIQDLFFNEMVSRAAKHSFNKLLRATSQADLAHSISHFLNCFLGTETGSISNDEKAKKAKQIKSTAVNQLTQVKLWSEIAETVQEKYDFEIPTHSVPMESRLIVLRCICLKMGIQIIAKDYNFTTDSPFSSEDIVDLFPIVKHINPRSTDGLDLLEAGKTFFNQRQFETATEFLSEALSIYHQVHGPIHPDASNCFIHLAMLAYQSEQYDLAIEHQKNALVITEKTMGLDHHDTVSCYTTLAVFCQNAGRYTESMGYLKHVLYLTDLLGGEFNPERSSIYTTVSSLLEETGKFDLAMEFLKQTLRHQEFLFGLDHIMSSTTYHKMALCSARSDNLVQGVEYQKQSLRILEKALGANHPRTKEANEYYVGLSQAFIQIQRFKEKQEQDLLKQQKDTTNTTSNNKESNNGTTTPPPSSSQRRFLNPPNANSDVLDLLNYINGKSKKKSTSKSSTTNTTASTSKSSSTASATKLSSSKSTSKVTASSAGSSSTPSSSTTKTTKKSNK